MEPRNLIIVKSFMNDQDPDQVGQFTRISQLLRKAGLEPDEAVELTERLGNMASSNVINEIRSYTKSQDSKFDFLKESQDSKFESLKESQDSKFESLRETVNSKINTLIWIGSILLATGVFNTLSSLLNWG